MEEDTKEPSSAADTSRQIIAEDLRFMKQQQWAITNYMVLILAGIVAIPQAFKDLGVPEKVIGTAFAVVTFAFGSYLLTEIQKDIGRARMLHDKIVERYLDKALISNLGLEPYRQPMIRGVLFVISMIAVSLMAMFTAIYSLWR